MLSERERENERVVSFQTKPLQVETFCRAIDFLNYTIFLIKFQKFYKQQSINCKVVLKSLITLHLNYLILSLESDSKIILRPFWAEGFGGE